MTITPGQSLTPEQVRNLPDGAVVRMHKSDRPYLELTVKNGELDIPNCSYNDTQPKGWFALPLATYRWESCLLVSLPPAPSEPGSRIEPQAEPAKPERQASEIEKRAAWALLGELSDDVRCAATGECADIDSANVLADACRQYIEAYDYAKSIGAIE